MTVGWGEGVAGAFTGAEEEEESGAAFAAIIQVIANTEVIAAVAITRESLRFRGAGAGWAPGCGGPSVWGGRAR